MKKRICLISTAQPVNDVRLFYREALTLFKNGYEVHIIIPNPTSEVISGIHIHSIMLTRFRLIRFFLLPYIALIRALNIQYDVYHLHDPELLVAGWLLKWVFKKNVILDIRESTYRQILTKPYIPKWARLVISKVYYFSERQLAKGIEIIVANDRSKEDFPQSYLVRNFPELDYSFIRSSPNIRERLKEPSLIYVGSISKSRGAITYVNLHKRLLMNGHNVRTFMIGQVSKDIEKTLKDKIMEANCQSSFFVLGRLEYTATLNYVSRAVIGLAILDPIPNYLFCLSGKIIEYMMCGTPVLCSKFSHWRKYVEKEGTGYMIDPQNIDEITNVCLKMLDDKEGLKKMSQKCKRVVQRKYNWGNELKELLRCYNKFEY